MFLESLEMPFMQRALIGGILVGLLSSYYGPIVVQRRLAFLGSGLAHAAFGGVALGVLLSVHPLWVAVPFTVLVALAIVWVREYSGIEPDTTIGIFFSVSMALGVIFLSMKQGYSGDAFTYLFGSILAITTTDLWITGAVTVLSLLTLPLWNRWAYATFDRSLAQADRLPVFREDSLLFVAIAVAIVVSIKVVGIVLMAAFLVLPPAAARLRARTFFEMTLLSVLIGLSSVVVGLFASYALDLPSGPVIILVQAAIFAILLPLRRRTG